MFNKKKKAAKAAAKAKAKADAAAKKAAAKKVNVNKIARPPVAPGAKPIDTRKPEDIKKKPVKPIPAVDKVKIHMLGNALIDRMQYENGKDYTVSMRTYKQIGTSCVSTAKWRAIQAKGGIGSLHK